MTPLLAFSDILASLSKVWSTRNRDQSLVSMAVPIKGLDPLICLPILSNGQQFRFLWDLSQLDSIAASGKTQHIELNGPRRFELAQRFSDSVFFKLLDVTPEIPINAGPKILFASSFFEQISERNLNPLNPPVLQAILPRWQLVRRGPISYLRINGVAIHKSDARELAEQLWIMGETLSKSKNQKNLTGRKILLGRHSAEQWQSCYKSVLSQGIDLVNSGEIEKIVLAVRKTIFLSESLDPLTILFRLREHQKNSCRFLWQNNQDESFFGASPERLLSLNGKSLFIDALAGTSSADRPVNTLISSEKDRREHQLVVSSIVNQLINQDLIPKFSKAPTITQYGNLFHLHTEISSKITFHKPLQLVNILHPTPAVAGLPVKEAMNWISILEPFDRGRYAAPIGWINSHGNAEFRVAIRCCTYKKNKLELIAGAGLVKGSIEENELKEVSLKLAVLADQFDLTPII